MTDIEKDAARYRWLRDTNNADYRNYVENGEIGMIDGIFVCDGPHCATALDADQMDDAIDSAMKRWPTL